MDITRRGLITGSVTLASGIAIGTAGEFTGDFVQRCFGDDRIEPTSLDITKIRLAKMRDNAIADARDIYAQTGSLNDRWFEMAEKAGVHRHTTRIQARDDGRQVIVAHGRDLALWGPEAFVDMVGVPLTDQPDPAFGRFVDKHIWIARQKGEISLSARRAETLLKNGEFELIEFLALVLVSDDRREAVSVALTVAEVAAGRSGAPLPRANGAHLASLRPRP